MVLFTAKTTKEAVRATRTAENKIYAALESVDWVLANSDFPA